MHDIGNKCAPYRYKRRKEWNNCNNIRNINSGFVSCEVDYIVNFSPGKLLALHIKKKYRLLYIKKGLHSPHDVYVFFFTCSEDSETFLVISAGGLHHFVIFVLRLCLMISISMGYMTIKRSFWKQICMKKASLGLYFTHDITYPI